MRVGMAKTWYRLRQFWHGFHATFGQITEQELTEAAVLLTPAAFLLFRRMAVDGQRHSLNVLNTLRSTGEISRELAAAALLHDVGKVAATEAGVEITLWWRGPLVLLETFAPNLLQRLSSSDPTTGWRYLFYVHLAHPAIGAQWAEAAGCDRVTCWLIAHHQDSPTAQPKSLKQSLLTRLQWADSQN